MENEHCKNCRCTEFCAKQKGVCLVLGSIDRINTLNRRLVDCVNDLEKLLPGCPKRDVLELCFSKEVLDMIYSSVQTANGELK